jgi:formylglycine-generating enzyme required for sulfatase activity
MVVIPPGYYDMGTSDDEVMTDEHLLPGSASIQGYVAEERPRHEVSIYKPFAIAKYPVTRGEFALFVKSTGYAPSFGCTLYSPRNHRYPFASVADWSSPGFAQSDEDPVVCVNWKDANAYIAWLNSQFEGIPDANGPYRLPSESEWEGAARAGTQTSRWWGNDIGQNNANCGYCGSQWDNRRTAPVGSFGPNPFGLYDVLGNVTEWTEDCWHKNYDQAPSDGQAWTTGNCSRRVARGGSWSGDQWVIRSATRFGLNAATRSSLTGFRVAKTLK